MIIAMKNIIGKASRRLYATSMSHKYGSHSNHLRIRKLGQWNEWSQFVRDLSSVRCGRILAPIMFSVSSKVRKLIYRRAKLLISQKKINCDTLHRSVPKVGNENFAKHTKM